MITSFCFCIYIILFLHLYNAVGGFLYFCFYELIQYQNTKYVRIFTWIEYEVQYSKNCVDQVHFLIFFLNVVLLCCLFFTTNTIADSSMHEIISYHPELHRQVQSMWHIQMLAFKVR